MGEVDGGEPDALSSDSPPRVGLATIVREWGRIGCIGFGGPPTHIALLRRLCVIERKWLSAEEFEDGVSATNLLPGPASTQLAIFCAWRLRGVPGAVASAFCFIVPGLILILALAALFLSGNPPSWVSGAAAGAGAAVAAVAAHAAIGLMPASWRRAHRPGQRVRWAAYLVFGGAATILLGPWLVLVLIACGLIEIVVRIRAHAPAGHRICRCWWRRRQGWAVSALCRGWRSRSVHCPTAAGS